MSGTDTITVQLEEADLVEAYRPAPRPTRLSRIALLLAFALVLLIVSLLVRFPKARLAFVTSPLMMALTGAVVLTAMLVVLLLLLAPALRRRAARSTLEHHPGMRDAIVYRLSDEEFAVETTCTTARYPWTELWDWRETERVFIVLPTPRNFYVLPSAAITPEAQELLRLRLARCRKGKA